MRTSFCNKFFFNILFSRSLILTSLFSILFSLLEIFILFLFKKEDRKFFMTSIASFVCISPYFAYIIYAHNFYINNFIDIDNGYQSIFTIIQNLFSPMLINVASANVLSHFQTLFREINFYSLGHLLVEHKILLHQSP